MLNLPKLKEYAEQLIDNSHGILHNVFISNGESSTPLILRLDHHAGQGHQGGNHDPQHPPLRFLVCDPHQHLRGGRT